MIESCDWGRTVGSFGRLLFVHGLTVGGDHGGPISFIPEHIFRNRQVRIDSRWRASKGRVTFGDGERRFDAAQRDNSHTADIQPVLARGLHQPRAPAVTGPAPEPQASMRAACVLHSLGL